jgi:hypothetical protein
VKFEHPPASSTAPLGNRHEHENDGGTVPTHLTHANSHADTALYHGLYHQGIVIGGPELECPCDYSNADGATISSNRESGGSASSRGPTCRAGVQVSWILSVKGLVSGFVYQLQCAWSLAGQRELFDSFITTVTSSYTVRKPLTQGGQNGASVFDMTFHMDVKVYDLYPLLTAEEALIGARYVNSAVYTFPVHCTNLDSGEWTKMPDDKADE